MTSLTAIAAVVAAICAWQARRVARIWRRFGGTRVVTCPETRRPAAVRLDVPHAAVSALFEGSADVRLAACSRWATRGPCDQPCVTEAQARERTVRAIAARWFAGKLCVYCGRSIDESQFPDHHGALLASDGKTREWPDVPAESLPEALRACWPVCWNCHVTETFRRTHPELVTDRPDTGRAS